MTGDRIDLHALRTSLLSAQHSACATDEERNEVLALLDAVEDAWAFWNDPSPETHANLDATLTRFEFGGP